MFGMIPYAFTVTSHIIVTFILASFIFVGVVAGIINVFRSAKNMQK
jgi:F-type H+-transporting ATPase subunit a